MAIYTNYGRFLKAKQFKDSLESAGDTYMVLGIGDHTWDNDRLSMPLASYDATSIRSPDSADTNQFFDDKVCQYILSNNCNKVLVDGGNIVGTVVENGANIIKLMGDIDGVVVEGKWRLLSSVYITNDRAGIMYTPVLAMRVE